MKIPYEFPIVFLDAEDSEQGEAEISYEQACIKPLQLQHEPYEAVIEERGYSFHVLFGSQVNGNFLCIPNWNVGCELASLQDQSWNLDSILQSASQLDYEDATAIVYALALLHKCITGTSAGA